MRSFILGIVISGFFMDEVYLKIPIIMRKDIKITKPFLVVILVAIFISLVYSMRFRRLQQKAVQNKVSVTVQLDGNSI